MLRRSRTSESLPPSALHFGSQEPAQPYVPSANLKSMDGCQNKLFRGTANNEHRVEVVCPKYPFGSGEAVSGIKSMLSKEKTRDEMAIVLGCVACDYREQVMKRVDTQTVLADGGIRTEVTFVERSSNTVPVVEE